MIFIESIYKRVAAAAFALACFAASHAQAQYAEPEDRFRVGFKGGVQFSNLYADEVSDENAKVGLNAGIFLRTPVSAIFSVQPELLYTQKGAKLNYTALIGNRRSNQINLGYLELPVLLRINPTRTFNVHVGPYGAYLIHANLSKEVVDAGVVSEGESRVDADNFQRFDYGAAAGLEFNLRWFDIGARYNLGLREVSNGSALSNRLANSAKNNTLSFYVGFVL